MPSGSVGVHCEAVKASIATDLGASTSSSVGSG